MKTATHHLVRLAHAGAVALVVGLAGCQSTPTPTKADASAKTALTCPITGEPVTDQSPSALYGVFPVYCSTVGDARQFASLAPKSRARLAKDQVLPQKGIRNHLCPITGEELTAAAAPATYEGETIGFASVADANQFRSLTPKKQAQIVAQWRTDEARTASAG